MKLFGYVVLSCFVSLIVSLRVPAGSADIGTDVWRIDSRLFQIPVCVEPGQREKIKELQLFASADEGKTWRQVASLGSNGSAFGYLAPSAGLYWFSVRVVKTDGTAEPSDVSLLPTALKVQVDEGKLKLHHKDTNEDIQGLKAEVTVLRQLLERIEKRISEIENAKKK